MIVFPLFAAHRLTMHLQTGLGWEAQMPLNCDNPAFESQELSLRRVLLLYLDRSLRNKLQHLFFYLIIYSFISSF